MNNEKISNEMADKLADIVFARNYTKGGLIRHWKEAGLIEESALEKANKLFNKLRRSISSLTDPILWRDVDTLGVLYGNACAELEARIKELEEGKK